MPTTEKNRGKNSMTVSNIGLANVISNPLGVSGTSIMQYLFHTDDFNEEYCKNLIKKRLKNKTNEIIESD